MYDAPGHAAIVRDYPRLTLSDRLGTLGDDYALAAGGYQDLSRYFAVQDRVAVNADPLEWLTVAGKLSSLAALQANTPLEAPLRARTVTLLSPVMARVGFEARRGETAPVSNLRETLVGVLGRAGDPAVVQRARTYVGQLATNPTAIPPAIRNPILGTYAGNATPAEWDALLRIAEAERSPVAKNRFISLLGAARDPATARRALELLRTDRITAPQKASLLRAIANAHPDLAFDWAVQNRALVNGFIEQSSQAGYVVGLGAGSTDPAMPGKITSYAERYLPEGSRSPAQRVIAGMAARREVSDRMRRATAKWVGATG
jgi:aminopeptidase N